MAPGAVLGATTRGGQTVSAILRADGWIEMAGKGYKSPSGAGAAAKEAAPGHPLSRAERATDGWYFWPTADSQGQVVTLKELRRRAAAP